MTPGFATANTKRAFAAWAENRSSLYPVRAAIEWATRAPATYAPTERKNTFPRFGWPAYPYSRLKLSARIA